MVNFTFIFYHHISHGRKVYNATNEIEPEKCLVYCVGQLLMSLTFQFLCVKSFQEVDHLSEHSIVLFWGLHLIDTIVSFGFYRDWSSSQSRSYSVWLCDFGSIKIPYSISKVLQYRLSTCSICNDQVLLTLILLDSPVFWGWPFDPAAENEAAIFGQPCQHNGHQHAQHQEDQTNAEVGSCSTDKTVSDSNYEAFHYLVSAWVCLCLRASLLTDDWAALAVSGELIVEDAKEHGEAEHQSDLERVAFTATQRQSEADHISQDDQNTGQQ